MKKLRFDTRLISLLGIVSLWLGLAGCGSTGGSVSSSSPAATPSAVTNPSAAKQAAAETTEKIKFKADNGSEVLSIKLMGDGAKVVDGNDRELARLKLDDRRKVKIKNSADKVLGYVVSSSGTWKLETADQSQELYILRHQPDGDYKLERGKNQALYRIKVRDYGFEIETVAKQSLYKIKLKEGKLSLRNAQDKTVLSTKNKLVPVAIASFGFKELSQEQQAALAYAVNLSGGK
ncbi:MAG: hypothetical protein KME16_18045 [Scytolyngbya sp. HA4215-MV1]|jgi:hypothetical protein|nr:hypothetical protein [Scytolyngbya sp. HA4215-MV1]